jgi:Neocarzinostatin family
VVEPSTDLGDGQVVAVHGSGFTPGGGVYMTQCRAGASDETGRACDLQKTLRNVTADNDGVVETTFTVRRTLNTSFYGTIDCATVPRAASSAGAAARTSCSNAATCRSTSPATSPATHPSKAAGCRAREAMQPGSRRGAHSRSLPAFCYASERVGVGARPT